jgi:D-arabinose 1-dehydrogenase-like Zn-dependent alcohol dehydrogenase
MTWTAVGDIPVDTVSLVLQGQSVHGWPSGHALDTEDAIQFAEYQDVKCMIETFPFDKVEDAVQRMESGAVRFRSVIVME